MILPDRGIREMVWPSNGSPEIFVPSDRAEFGAIQEQQIQPASLDVRLARNIISHSKIGDANRWIHDEGWILEPGECILGTLVESFNMNADNVAARIEGKSSWARRFLTIHSAGFIDPGFCGDVTLEIKNDGKRPIVLLPGCKIAQVSFQFLAGPALRLYGDPALGSHYQNQVGATRSWIQG